VQACYPQLLRVAMEYPLAWACPLLTSTFPSSVAGSPLCVSQSRVRLRGEAVRSSRFADWVVTAFGDSPALAGTRMLG